MNLHFQYCFFDIQNIYLPPKGFGGRMEPKLLFWLVLIYVFRGFFLLRFYVIISTIKIIIGL